MKNLLLMAAAAAYFGVAGAAAAADLYDGPGSLKDGPLPVTPVATWGGFYVGGHVGWGWRGDRTVDVFKKKKHKYWDCWSSGECNCNWKWSDYGDYKEVNAKHSKKFKFDDVDDDGFLGGVHVGYNFQSGNVVYGLEGDVSIGEVFDYLASFRGRLGYAHDSWLFYATAGIAFAKFNTDLTISSKHHKVKFDGDGDKQVGFVVGGGFEKKIRDDLSFGIEGLYYAFGDEKQTHKWDKDFYCGWGCKKKYKFETEDDLDLWVVRARLTYHLQSVADYEPLK